MPLLTGHWTPGLGNKAKKEGTAGGLKRKVFPVPNLQGKVTACRQGVAQW
jgi:hypothetical protein